jgi:hypothetical protein
MDKKQGFSPASRSMLHRIYFIDRRIASGKYPNTKRLLKNTKQERQPSAATSTLCVT